MKRTAIITGFAVLALNATVNAQTEPVAPPPPPAPPEAPAVPATEAPERTDTVPYKAATSDKYNNWSSDQYKMQALPDALTQDKVFPAVGRYEVTDREGAQSSVTITLDESNKGFVWVDGLPQGRIKALLRKSPSTYKIPAQKIGEDEKTAQSIAEGVLIYDKDANVLNVCLGCSFDAENPAIAFAPAAETEEEAVTDAKPAKKTAAKTKAKVAKVKPIHYSGTKVLDQTAATAPIQ